MEEQTINLPQLLILLVLGGLAIRYFFFSSNPSTVQSRSATSANNIRAREADVERIQQMFPQVSRRNIMWDLQRNGGNVVATTERILSGRGLEVPPQSFQPPLPVAASSSSASTASTPAQAKPSQPDLITRYNLKSKLAEEASRQDSLEEETAKQKQGQAWSQNKGERQALLQKRREEMILTARRKMEAKVAAEVGEMSQGTS
ncbi:related to AMFR protein [Phialocephala subalpina]|uniref:Coupling of ubiquitin conjugation to ER degradation protein 1 n=1 Tax=Phialocephala subalpina TaxID=576137 RepID=A0A1L7XBM6_9HELO|nr:related to AMFR protein [Phialocephala subalpina]